MLNVQSIFNSIDGEVNGFKGAGELTTFIRLKGCNLRCKFCDTKYALLPDPRNDMSLDQIFSYPNRLDKVTITGGEPLLQPDTPKLISLLLEAGCKVSIETNGSISLPSIKPITSFKDIFEERKKRNLRYIVDYKLPSTGMECYMQDFLFEELTPNDIIKFVISDMEDYNRAIDIIKENKVWEAQIVFSPGFSSDHSNTNWATELANTMVLNAENFPYIQYSLQVHKVLWPNCAEEK